MMFMLQCFVHRTILHLLQCMGTQHLHFVRNSYFGGNYFVDCNFLYHHCPHLFPIIHGGPQMVVEFLLQWRVWSFHIPCSRFLQGNWNFHLCLFHILLHLPIEDEWYAASLLLFFIHGACVLLRFPDAWYGWFLQFISLCEENLWQSAHWLKWTIQRLKLNANCTLRSFWIFIWF